MMDPGYGALDPTNPRDRAWAAAWRVNEELKQAWAKTGYAPERAPSLFNATSPSCSNILTNLGLMPTSSTA